MRIYLEIVKFNLNKVVFRDVEWLTISFFVLKDEEGPGVVILPGPFFSFPNWTL